MKSHHGYGTEYYPSDLDCYATFKAPARSYSQRLMIEVIDGHISGGSFFAFETKNNSEKFTNIKNVAIRREWQVLRGQEDKKFFTVRFNAAGARDRGFLVKFSVSPPDPPG